MIRELTCTGKTLVALEKSGVGENGGENHAYSTTLRGEDDRIDLSLTVGGNELLLDVGTKYRVTIEAVPEFPKELAHPDAVTATSQYDRRVPD